MLDWLIWLELLRIFAHHLSDGSLDPRDLVIHLSAHSAYLLIHLSAHCDHLLIHLSAHSDHLLIHLSAHSDDLLDLLGDA
jgi:hypothetical protein